MTAIRRVCILGAGSIGSLYAGHLGALVDVVVLTRRAEHAQQLNKHGLRVSGKTQRHVQVQASIDGSELGEVDLVILATKTFDVEAAARRLAESFPGVTVMTIQNGLGCEELVARYGNWPIISAVTFMAGTRHSDIHVEYELDTATWLGPWPEGSATFADAQRVATLLEESGLIAKALENLFPAQWSKLIFNSVVNSVSAVTELPLCQAYVERQSTYDLGHLVHGMMQEGKHVASALGIELYEDPWEMCVRGVKQASKEAGDGRVPSMLVDVRAHRQTEIEWITGVVIREAARVGVHVPITETLYRLVKAREVAGKSNGGTKQPPQQ